MAAHSDGDKCINCDDRFEKKTGGFRRFSVARILNKSREVREILTELLDLSTSPVTPISKSTVSVEKRCLCYICYSDLEKIEKRQADIAKKQTELESLKRDFTGRTKQGTYLSGKVKIAAKRKVVSPVKTPPRIKKFRQEEAPGPSQASVPPPSPIGLSGTDNVPTPKPSTTKKKRRSTGFLKLVIRKIEQKEYGGAFRFLLRRSDRARRDFLGVLCSLVRKEMTEYIPQSIYTSQLLTMEVAESFSWSSFFKETRYHLPIIHTVIESAVTTRNSADKVSIDGDGCIGPHVPGIGLVMSVLLHLKRRNRFRMVQSLIAAQLYKHGCTQKLQTWFQKAGMSLSVCGTRNIIDRLIKSFDKDANVLKKNIEILTSPKIGHMHESTENLAVELSPPNREELASLMMEYGELKKRTDADVCSDDEWSEVEDSEEEMSCDTAEGTSQSEETETEASEIDTQQKGDQGAKLSLAADDTDGQKSSRRSLFSTSEDMEQKGQHTEITPVKGYSLTWDNVQRQSMTRHHGTERGNKFNLWALAFMTEQRIQFHHLNDQKEVLKAESIPLQSFLPSREDWDRLKDRMCIISQRILIKHFPMMQDIFADCVQDHIPHQYSHESTMKSHVINLGVYSENPSTTKGTVRILRNLKKYVPEEDGEGYAVLVNGDQLSVERMVTARMSMASSEQKFDRFTSLQPSPQEFHKRCLLLQDTMNKLYSTKSVSEKGTLYQMRNKFGHRGVKKHVMDCVNYTVDFLNFCTEGMLCLLAMKVGGMEDLSEKPKDAPSMLDPLEVRKEFFDSFVQKIVESCWPHIYHSTITGMSRAEVEEDEEEVPQCTCDGKDIGDTFTIECSAQQKCNRVRFYHPSCVGLVDQLPEEDWWCSPECREYTKFCICETNVKDQWIGCESSDLCIRARQGWFHLKCAGLRQIPEGDWYCSKECEDFCKKHSDCCERNRYGAQDHIQEYSCAVLWEGLWHMVHRDAERENDGPVILSHWKLDMLSFWANNHFKYLLLGHRLLAARLREEITWNRVANLTGGAGHNIALDLVNEFLNNDFKENLKRTRGNLSPGQIERTSKLIGTVGKSLDNIFERQVMDKYVKKSKSSRFSHKTDILKFIKDYKNCRLFDQIPGRSHASFNNFSHTIMVKCPGKLKARLQKHGRSLDIETEVLSMA